jgi:acyl-coenzyme A thioesterase PaaI-like protein
LTRLAEPLLATMQQTRRRAHPHCIACGAAHPFGLRLEFTIAPDGGVASEWIAPRRLESYPGRVHGGVVSTLLDAAMTHCLFAHGRTAVTGELRVRFRLPVDSTRPLTVRAWLCGEAAPLLLTEAELTQDGEVKATARAKFLDQPELAGRDEPPA